MALLQNAPGGQYLTGAIICGVVLLVLQWAGIAIGILGTILTAACVILFILWILAIVGVI
jgi:hypothetical protein